MSFSGHARFDPAVLLRSYAKDVRHWAVGIAASHAIAVGLVLVAAISLIVAFGVGASALFHYIETTSGPYAAFAIIGGFFFVLGVFGMIGGLGLWKRSIPPFPRPRVQTRLMKTSLVLPAAARLLAGRRTGNPGADPVTQILAAAAAGTLIVWIAASWMGRSSARPRSRG